jgi:mannose-6-phosphate isomerase-like protein (cupin superfamily)
MDRTPMPTSFAAALALAKTSGRSREIFRDNDLEIRFAAKLPDGLHAPHPRDEVYIVAAGTASYRFEDRVVPVAPGDLLFAAAHIPHSFEQMSDDFCLWVIFYGPEK